LINKKRSDILDKWFKSIIGGYPLEAAQKFASIKDRFQNPIGASVSEGIIEIFDGLIGQWDENSLIKGLDRIIRLRSVQNFSASEAVSFIFVLKNIIADTIDTGKTGDPLKEELDGFNRKIDQLALLGFDVYSGCREKIFELKINQAKGMVKPFRGFDGKRRLPE
jgi:hypothetical protein